MKKAIWDYLNDEIFDLEILGHWFLSNTYKASGKNDIYVIREIIPWISGFEYQEDIVKSFGISHKMYKNIEIINKVKSYGVCLTSNKCYHIQSYKSWKLLNDIGFLNQDNVKKIARKIWYIHNLWKKEIDFDDDYKNILYKKSFRKVITHQETILSIYEKYILWSDYDKLFFQNLIKKMFDTYFDYLEKADFTRLSYLHWDFWNGNFIEDKEDVYFIDFSRIPYWEPWIDIWTMVANFEIFALVNDDIRLIDLKNKFLEEYIKVTKDVDIVKYFKLSKMLVLFLHFSPLLQSFLNRSNDTKNKVLKNFII